MRPSDKQFLKQQIADGGLDKNLRDCLTRLVNESLVSCALCPGCHERVSFVAPVPTLIVNEEPLDSNDRRHWECVHCGYSDVPAEWIQFLAPASMPLELEIEGDQREGWMLF